MKKIWVMLDSVAAEVKRVEGKDFVAAFPPKVKEIETEASEYIMVVAHMKCNEEYMLLMKVAHR